MIYTLIPSPLAAALCAVATYNGVQTGAHDEPLFEVWTLTVTLTPFLIAGSTYARHSIEPFLSLNQLAA